MDEKEVVNGQSDLNGEIAALHSEDELLLEILTEAKALHEEASIQAKEQKAIKKDDGSEIFSNKNKEPRLININPLDLDGGSAQNAERENAKKLLKQLEAQRMAKTIEFSEPVQPAEEAEQPQEVTAQPKKTTALISEDSIEISLQVGAKMNQTDDDETPSITTANIKTVGTVEEEKISPYEKHFGTDTFDSLRVLKDYEDDVSNYEKLFGTPKPTNIEAQAVINRVPNYRAEIKLDKINLSAGKFSEILESEYLEYVGSNDPMITQSAEPAAPASTAKGEQKPEKKSFTAALTGLFANKNRESTSTQRADIVEDFNTPKDAKKIFAELTQNHRKLKLRSVVLAFCAVLSFALVIVRSVLTSGGTTETQGLSFVFALLNIFILTAAIIISHVVIANGLVPLIRFKGNSDTAPAAAAAASFLQAVAALFGADAFFSGALGIFTPIVITSLFLNALGKIFILRRVRANFKFVAEKGKKFAVKIFANDQKTAQKLVAGSAAAKPLIAYQHKTNHLNNFLKISYAPDLS
ncbi:MAG: hypothetical protein LBM65_02930, partial [Oscillospiraceae bacterium]|nr:hypothetical protein [Oscillospiraceae bacterium]